MCVCVCVCVCVTCEFQFKLVCGRYTVSALMDTYNDKVTVSEFGHNIYCAAKHAQAEHEVLTVV